MTRQHAQIVAVVLVLLGTAAAAAAQTEELVRTIRMDPGGRFMLTNVGGDITVTGVDGDDLTIRAIKRVAGRGAAADDALSRVEIEIEERGNRVAVETHYPRHRRSFLQSLASLFSGGERVPFVAVDYLVTVPRATGVAIESFSGDVTVEGVDGETRVEIASGDGRLASLARLVEVRTFSGDLELADVRSDDALVIRAASGRLDIAGVRAPRLQVKSFSGPVVLNGVASRRVKVETASGSVSFDGSLAADGQYGFQSHSGDIFLSVPDDSGFELEAQSFSGDLRSDIPILVGGGDPTRQGPVSLEGGSRAIRGIAAAGGARLELSTASGDMTISAGDTATGGVSQD